MLLPHVSASLTAFVFVFDFFLWLCLCSLAICFYYSRRRQKPPIYAKTLLTTASSLMRFYFIYFLIPAPTPSLFLRYTPSNSTPNPSISSFSRCRPDFRFRSSRVNVGNFCFYCRTSSVSFFFLQLSHSMGIRLNVICLLSSFRPPLSSFAANVERLTRNGAEVRMAEKKTWSSTPSGHHFNGSLFKFCGIYFRVFWLSILSSSDIFAFKSRLANIGLLR